MYIVNLNLIQKKWRHFPLFFFFKTKNCMECDFVSLFYRTNDNSCLPSSDGAY